MNVVIKITLRLCIHHFSKAITYKKTNAFRLASHSGCCKRENKIKTTKPQS